MAIATTTYTTASPRAPVGPVTRLKIAAIQRTRIATITAKPPTARGRPTAALRVARRVGADHSAESVFGARPVPDESTEVT